MGLAKLPKSLYSKHSSFKQKRNAPSYFFKTLFHSSEALEEEAMWIVDDWSNNYFHWITDVLPRLLLIQRATSCTTLLLPKKLLMSDFVTASLHLFDIQNLVEINSEKALKCRRLLVVDTKMVTGNYDEKSIDNIRTLHITAYSNFPVKEPHERLYISRSKASRRRILNEHEIMPILDEYGFHSVCMEDYSFEEQIKLAIPAKYLIANHGAGMTNMIFMQSKGSVLELRREDDMQNNCYFSLSSALSLNYYYQLCSAEPLSKVENFTNIIVSAELLRRNIQLMLTQS
ncbi:MAG: glycosyltransferase family 61 protein [Cyanobacteria bacterium P01_D01_bin.56]